MSTEVITKEQLTRLLNNWYQSILKQQFVESKQLKEDIDYNINNAEQDHELLFYYSLLNFRYKVLTDWIEIKEDSFDQVESFKIPSEGFLAYYYHFFKAFHFTLITKYKEAKEQYEKAEKLLKYVQNPFEQAEFNYRLGYFYYQSYQQILAIDYIKKAKEEFAKHEDYQINAALCENMFALCCIDLKQFEQAEESFNTALDVFKKLNSEKAVLMVRSNLGWLYGSQNLSELAIRHISEVVEKSPRHYKAIFTMAEENYKLGRIELANEFIKSGLNLCNELKNKEFQHRFIILQELNRHSHTTELEKVVLEGISYFESEGLWECVKEYTEKLALKFYEEENNSKASQYFYMSIMASKKYREKGALK